MKWKPKVGDKYYHIINGIYGKGVSEKIYVRSNLDLFFLNQKYFRTQNNAETELKRQEGKNAF